MRPGGLTPDGTARALLDGEPAGARFPLKLRAALRDHDLGDEALFLAWELTGWPSGLAPGDRYALHRLVLASMVSVRQGSTRLPLDAAGRARFLQPLYLALGGSDAELERAIALLGDSALAQIVGRPGDYKPLVVDGSWLYHQRILASEERLVEALQARLKGTATPRAPAPIDAALADVLARPAVQRGKQVRLSAEQQAAVRTALSAQLTVISGGPGTGKTSIVASLLRVLARLDVPPESVALAAPTGKAAYRMRESIERSLKAIAEPAAVDAALRCPDARTLHRLLGYSPRAGGRFLHHENNRLAESVVIVDEGSMIDLYLMERLLRAVRDDAALVLLGDADQLPSVDAGAVFRDLLPCTPSGVRLTESYRMDPIDPAGRAILLVARAMQAGQPLDGIETRATAGVLAFERVERVEASERTAFFERWWRERVRGSDELVALGQQMYRLGVDGAFADDDRQRLERLFDHVESARILCATRGGQPGTGAAWVNDLLHRRRVADARMAGESEPGALGAGEPVMMQHNDYERGLFNGDQGLVLRVATPHEPRPQHMVVFPRPDGHQAFHLEPLKPALRLSYAITIHKSQGSEFDHVAVLLPDEDLPLLTRELLYTAVTRSRRSVVIVGAQALLEAAAARQVRRFSGIADKLGGTAPAGGGGEPGPAPPSRRSRNNPNQLKLPW